MELNDEIKIVGSISRYKRISYKFEFLFDFKVPDYIIFAIANGITFKELENYVHIAIYSFEDITNENAKTFLDKIEKMLEVKNKNNELDSEKIEPCNIYEYDEKLSERENFNKNYREIKNIELKKYLSKKAIDILEKFGIKVKETPYSQYEYDSEIGDPLLDYQESEEKDSKVKTLPSSVTENEFKELLKELNKLNIMYNL